MSSKTHHPLTIKKAVPEDLPAIVDLFQHAITHMRAHGIDQWDELYPDPETLRQDIASGSQYICLQEGSLAAAFALNGDCDPEYTEGTWRYGTPFNVVHRLCVDPRRQGTGIGRKTMLSIETMAREQGIVSLRLDAFSQNPAALWLYEKLGFEKAGTITFRKGRFVLYEKLLADPVNPAARHAVN